MMPAMVFALPGNEAMAESLARALDAELGLMETRSFPDGETYLRIASNPAGRSVALICTLHRPDDKFLRLAFAAETIKQMDASSVGLVAPYLSYMRQDRRFAPGEALTSATFARILSPLIDWLVTVDPHLHRYQSLGEIYTIPAYSLHAAPLLAGWIRTHVRDPLLIGPDVESEQWVSEVATSVGAPHQVLRKTRRGDRNVDIEVPDLRSFSDRTPVLIDDIVSTGRTMVETAHRLAGQGLCAPVCIAVHALFSEAAFQELNATASTVVTTNSVPHSSNGIDVTGLIVKALRSLR
ncbi:ribose-phosphate pyrophosphokinase [Chelativorans alearense]|uniref:ribose-phosphate pyrophosphokinase n=1 Tax=Chelativorans alearense TaxID=2681495 RepID=UPI001FE9DDCF|nr:ribose-phosphate pyrophosphokinase [Chelativorans alearense]